MPTSRLMPALSLALAALVLAGCETPGSPVPGASSTNPYAGLEDSPVRGLRLAEIAELENGTGMGLALPAELNGWPGPRHVLDLAAALGLDESQVAQVAAVRDAMMTDAKAQGRSVLAAYAAMDALFREGHPDAGAIQDRAEAIGREEAKLRAIHLEAHVVTMGILTPQQVGQYAQLRGYDAAHDGQGGHGGH